MESSFNSTHVRLQWFVRPTLELRFLVNTNFNHPKEVNFDILTLKLQQSPDGGFADKKNQVLLLKTSSVIIHKKIYLLRIVFSFFYCETLIERLR